jgi:flagellum-specific peptidoglycan hydrolase FlgJ
VSLSPEQQDALKEIAQAAVLSEKETGCPAEMSAAQCIFESDWLTRAPGNNCFGIKSDAHGSGTQYILTHEYLNGQWEEMPLAFETYATLADCFSDHARLIQSGVYAPAWGRYQQNHDLNAYILAVSAHYATDPDYAQKITQEANSSTVQMAVQAARQGITA